MRKSEKVMSKHDIWYTISNTLVLFKIGGTQSGSATVYLKHSSLLIWKKLYKEWILSGGSE